MSQFLITVSMWLHALAAVIFIGHYLLLSLLYIPVLAAKDPAALSEISKRSRRWLYAALLIFFVSGIHLMLVDPRYLGLANFGNAWTVLMLVKHMLALVMIAMGFWFNAILRVGPLLVSNTGAVQATNRLRLHAGWMAVLGALVLLLTAVAQVQ